MSMLAKMIAKCRMNINDALWWYDKRKDLLFLKRKKALIDRDPLTEKFLKLLSMHKPPAKRTKGLDELKKSIEQKWSVLISISEEEYYWNSLPGSKPFNQAELFYIHHLIPKEPIMEDDLIVSVGDGKVIIQFELNLLDKSTNTEKFVKDSTWAVIKRRLAEYQKKSIDACPELDFLFKLRQQSTFDKYIKWYDLHMGGDYQVPKGLSFRAIATCEIIERKRPHALEEGKKRIEERTRIRKTSKGPGILTGVIGEPVKGEDAVGHAIKTIYKAIHRTPYSFRRKLELYECPNHGPSCPISGCKSFEKWLERADRRILWPPYPKYKAKYKGRGRRTPIRRIKEDEDE